MHPLKRLILDRENDKSLGVVSVCSGNEFVIEAAIKVAKKHNTICLIEATANQVDQYGGYTGMYPKDFYNLVYSIGDKVGIDKDKLVLGGDHLGPLTFSKLDENEAMEKAEVLVYEYAKAGFTKIHLDTSMKVASDGDGALSVEVVARRGAILYKEAIRGYNDRLKEDSNAIKPVFVIGSEVPIPGGATEKEDSISVTKVSDFNNTIEVYTRVFKEEGIEEGLENVIGVVVQPGVEFGDDEVFYYNRENARDLVGELNNYKEICFEGHSTDYQRKEDLKNMVLDGIAILKVGPALTFYLREALFSLTYIERELVKESFRADFIETLEAEMTKNKKNWENHYGGSEEEKKIKRKYSYSDRCRYYLGEENVKKSISKLIENLEKVDIPLSIIHQYLPLSYNKIVSEELNKNVRDILLDSIENALDDYIFAIK